jgi:hypothetical protein
MNFLNACVIEIFIDVPDLSFHLCGLTYVKVAVVQMHLPPSSCSYLQVCTFLFFPMYLIRCCGSIVI